MKRKYYTIHGNPKANSINNASVLPSISNTIYKKLNYPRHRIVGNNPSIVGSTNTTITDYVKQLEKQVIQCGSTSQSNVYVGDGTTIPISNGEYIKYFKGSVCPN